MEQYKCVAGFKSTNGKSYSYSQKISLSDWVVLPYSERSHFRKIEEESSSSSHSSSSNDDSSPLNNNFGLGSGTDFGGGFGGFGGGSSDGGGATGNW